MINQVALTGRLTKDVDLRYTPQGTPAGTFTLAINRNFTNQQGNTEADFINCVVWRKTAELMANSLRKGSLIGVTGRIQTRTYDNQQGQKVYVTEVVVDGFSYLESRDSSESRANNPSNSNSYSGNRGNNQSNSQPSYGGSNNYGGPAANQNFNRDPFGGNGNTTDIRDEDLPF